MRKILSGTVATLYVWEIDAFQQDLNSSYSIIIWIIFAEIDSLSDEKFFVSIKMKMEIK